MTSHWTSLKYLLLMGVLLIAGLVKLVLLLTGSVPFNADEAVVGLMARHILAGEYPVFFWGQAYMGSLDAYFVAVGFMIFGSQVWVIRLVQTILFLGTVWTTILLGARIFNSDNTGLLAGLLLAIPSVNLVLYTTASLGGYGEALLLGNLILLSSLRLGTIIQSQPDMPTSSQVKRPILLWLAIFSFLTGVGLWTLGLTIVYALPAGIFLLVKLYKKCFFHRGTVIIKLLAITLVGFLVGSLPWWVFAIQHGFHALMGELLGGAVAIETGPVYLQWLSHLVNLLLLGLPAALGVRPPWEVRWLALPLAPIALAFWAAAVISASRWFRRNHSEPEGTGLLWGVILTLIAGFIFTPFGIDPSGRYFLPIGIVLALFGANFLQRLTVPKRIWKYIIVVFVLAFNGTGIVQSAVQNPPGITTQFNPETLTDHRYDQELVRFLQQQGETRGYTTYWVSYPLAFLTNEQIIFIPQLPYHHSFQYTARDDRYASYQKVVAESSKGAYITVNQLDLDDRLRLEFHRIGISWQEQKIGDYQIFYKLSEKITPAEMVSIYSVN